MALKTLEFTGADGLMWGSDYPHDEGTFPHSQDVIERTLLALIDVTDNRLFTITQRRYTASPEADKRNSRRLRMSWEPELEELRRREAFARELGGPEKVKRQKDAGKMTVRERVWRWQMQDRFGRSARLPAVANTMSTVISNI